MNINSGAPRKAKFAFNLTNIKYSVYDKSSGKDLTKDLFTSDNWGKLIFKDKIEIVDKLNRESVIKSYEDITSITSKQNEESTKIIMTGRFIKHGSDTDSLCPVKNYLAWQKSSNYIKKNILSVNV